MQPERSLAFLADDPPIRDDVHGWGLARVNARLVDALAPKLSVIACGSNGIYSKDDLAADLSSRTIMWNEQTRWKRFQRRRLRVHHDAEREFDRGLRRIRHLLARENPVALFSPCGVDPNALRHAAAVKKLADLPVAVYLVDDFIDGATLAGNSVALQQAAQEVPSWIAAMDKVFVISEGLRERVWHLYRRESTVLALPYPTPTPNRADATIGKQIIFVGNLSHFYLDGLRDLVEVLTAMNREGAGITLRFTLPSAEAVEAALGRHDFIECRPCVGSAALRDEVARSMAAFAPYSFDEKYAVMVATSFPSKLLDYLSAARLVLVYGPAASTSARYFAEHGLEHSIGSRSLPDLRAAIEHAAAAPASQAAAYRDVVRSVHAPEHVARQITDALL